MPECHRETSNRDGTVSLVDDRADGLDRAADDFGKVPLGPAASLEFLADEVAGWKCPGHGQA
jgi:hypothetical protein